MNLDRLLGVLLLLLSALLWWVIIPNEVPGFEQGLMPRLVTVLLAVSSFGLCLRPGPEKVPSDRPSIRGMLCVAGMMVLYLAYILCVPLVGFFVSSAVATQVFMWLLGVRRTRTFVLVPFVMLGSIWLIITQLLQYPLPEGILF